MGIDLKVVAEKIRNHHKLAVGAVAGAVVCSAAVCALTALLPKETHETAVTQIKDDVVALAGFWPTSFTSTDYIEPEFADDENRTNNAFNVADFGEQGNNGWFYRYGSSQDPARSRRLESFDGERYYEAGKTGLEMKNNFLHTAEGTAPILSGELPKPGMLMLSSLMLRMSTTTRIPSTLTA